MKRNRITRIALALACTGLLFTVAGCKSKDPQKADSCTKSAVASLNVCESCCKEAGYSGYSWTSESCRCM